MFNQRLMDDFFNVGQKRYFLDEDNQNFYFSVDLPGFGKDDLEVKVEGLTLSIKGEVEGRKYNQSFTLPKAVDTNKIEATVDKGVLSVALGKKENASPRLIPIN